MSCCEKGNENSGFIKRKKFPTTWRIISFLRTTLSYGGRRSDFDIGRHALEPELFCCLCDLTKKIPDASKFSLSSFIIDPWWWPLEAETCYIFEKYNKGPHGVLWLTVYIISLTPAFERRMHFAFWIVSRITLSFIVVRYTTSNKHQLPFTESVHLSSYYSFINM